MARQPALTEVAAREETQRDKALAAPKDLRAYLQKLIEHDPETIDGGRQRDRPDL